MKIKIADTVFEIIDFDERFKAFFKDYETNDSTEYQIQIKNHDLVYEKKLKADSPYLMAIYRKLIEILIDKDIIFFHGSAFVCDGFGIIISGRSGSGKSTHASLYQTYNNITYINDDKPLLAYKDNKFYIYGTPYMGKYHLGSNINHQLDKICFVKQSTNNNIEEIQGDQKMTTLIKQVHLPENIDARIKVIKFVSKLAKQIPVYELQCDISNEAYNISYQTLCKK